MNDKQIEANEFRFRVNLIKTHRRGVDTLYESLKQRGFFEKPASKYHHNNFKGGLCEHSLNVFDTFRKVNKKMKDNYALSLNSIRIVTLLHDVVKCLDKPEKHGATSVNFICNYIKLKEVEREMILGHMGFYGCYYNDYTNYIANEYMDENQKIAFNFEQYVRLANKNPLVKLLHWVDDYCTQFVEEIETNTQNGLK